MTASWDSSKRLRRPLPAKRFGGRTSVRRTVLTPVSGRRSRLSACARFRTSALAGGQQSHQSAFKRCDKRHQPAQGPRQRLGDERQSVVCPQRCQARDGESHQLGQFVFDSADDGLLQKVTGTTGEVRTSWTPNFPRSGSSIAIVVVVGGVLGYKYWKSSAVGPPGGDRVWQRPHRSEALRRLCEGAAQSFRKCWWTRVTSSSRGQVLVQLEHLDARRGTGEESSRCRSSAKEELAAANAAIAEAKADIATANADIAGAKADVASANATIEQQQGEVQLAQTEGRSPGQDACRECDLKGRV